MHRDIVYKEADGEPIKLDVYLPKVRKYEKSPVVVYIHGGGWTEGDKRLKPATWGYMFDKLGEEGYAGVSINYRLLVGRNAANFTAPVIDCQDALRWLVKHGERYGLDTDRIIVAGSSAGGHLALMAGLAADGLFPGDPQLAGFSANVRAILSWYGVTDLTKMLDRAAPPPELTAEQFAALLRTISPINHLHENAPPMLLMHGLDDSVVPYTQSSEFYEAGRSLGLDVRYVPVKHAEHSYRPAGDSAIEPSLDEILHMTMDFIRRF